ncbi:MAG TPA: hypothetical protein VJ813_07660 [Vicinamibacterales bacterium]|nr:hypothetical protein [Vicinamibacterales bacterium]
MRFCLAVFCLFAATGCFLESPAAPAPVDQELTLAPGESRPVGGASLTVTFAGVVGDNRCPADALCVLGGSATVRVQLAGPRGRQDVTFETGNLQPVKYDAFTLELVQLAPYPFSATTIRPEDYRATLRITR